MAEESRPRRKTRPEQTDPVDVDSAADADAPDPVGYRRPPKHAQFKPGQSGNPRGRPAGVKSLSDIVRKIVGQKVTITENGRMRRISRLEAILLRAAGEASRGDARALRLLVQLTERYGENAQAGVSRDEMAAEDITILQRYLPDFEVSDPQQSGPEAVKEAKHGGP
jgi:Family of unknown function (DUF5681)